MKKYFSEHIYGFIGQKRLKKIIENRSWGIDHLTLVKQTFEVAFHTHI